MDSKKSKFDHSVFTLRTWTKMALVLASCWCMAGCGDEDSSNTNNTNTNPRPVVKCEAANDCAGLTDGRIHCDETLKQCVFPSVKCEVDNDCAGLKDGRTRCGEGKQCVFPPSQPGMYE